MDRGVYEDQHAVLWRHDVLMLQYKGNNPSTAEPASHRLPCPPVSPVLPPCSPVHRSDSRLKEFGGVDVGDERAALLDPNRKPAKSFASEETLRQFDFRQYLFARRAAVRTVVHHRCCRAPCGLLQRRVSLACMHAMRLTSAPPCLTPPPCLHVTLCLLKPRMRSYCR